MSLDDRLRGAYQRQLEDVWARVDSPSAENVPDVVGSPPARRESGSPAGRRTAGPGPGIRLIRAAAAVGLVLTGAALLVRALPDGPGDPVRTEAADRDGVGGIAEDSASPTTTSAPSTSGTPAPSTSGTSMPSSSTATTAAAGTLTTEVTASTTGTGTPTDPTPPPPTDPSASTAAPSTPTTSSPTTPGPATVGGVGNAVCPTEARAELEWAALRYVGENRGWGRKDDLVDEQDGPYYFEAWEPNHPDPVSVEVLLKDPVLATEIRLAQDPFTEVAGTIEVEVGAERFGIELSGTDGWRVHRFDQPQLLDRFTITRTAIESNVMEVLVCVVADP